MVAENAFAHEKLWRFVTIGGMRTSAKDFNNGKDAKRTWFAAASWAAVALMAAAIFAMSATSGVDLDENSGLLSAVKEWLATAIGAAVGRPVDVSPIGHFTEYLIFGGLLVNALRFHVSPQRATLAAPVLASLYGITDELHQIFTPGRSCDPMDWAVDTVAAIAGALIAWALLKRR